MPSSSHAHFNRETFGRSSSTTERLNYDDLRNFARSSSSLFEDGDFLHPKSTYGTNVGIGNKDNESLMLLGSRRENSSEFLNNSSEISGNNYGMVDFSNSLYNANTYNGSYLSDSCQTGANKATQVPELDCGAFDRFPSSIGYLESGIMNNNSYNDNSTTGNNDYITTLSDRKNNFLKDNDNYTRGRLSNGSSTGNSYKGIFKDAGAELSQNNNLFDCDLPTMFEINSSFRSSANCFPPHKTTDDLFVGFGQSSRLDRIKSDKSGSIHAADSTVNKKHFEQHFLDLKTSSSSSSETHISSGEGSVFSLSRPCAAEANSATKSQYRNLHDTSPTYSSMIDNVTSQYPATFGIAGSYSGQNDSKRINSHQEEYRMALMNVVAPNAISQSMPTNNSKIDRSLASSSSYSAATSSILSSEAIACQRSRMSEDQANAIHHRNNNMINTINSTMRNCLSDSSSNNSNSSSITSKYSDSTILSNSGNISNHDISDTLCDAMSKITTTNTKITPSETMMLYSECCLPNNQVNRLRQDFSSSQHETNKAANNNIPTVTLSGTSDPGIAKSLFSTARLHADAVAYGMSHQNSSSSTVSDKIGNISTTTAAALTMQEWSEPSRCIIDRDGFIIKSDQVINTDHEAAARNIETISSNSRSIFDSISLKLSHKNTISSSSSSSSSSSTSTNLSNNERCYYGGSNSGHNTNNNENNITSNNVDHTTTPNINTTRDRSGAAHGKRIGGSYSYNDAFSGSKGGSVFDPKVRACDDGNKYGNLIDPDFNSLSGSEDGKYSNRYNNSLSTTGILAEFRSDANFMQNFISDHSSLVFQRSPIKNNNCDGNNYNTNIPDNINSNGAGPAAYDPLLSTQTTGYCSGETLHFGEQIYFNSNDSKNGAHLSNNSLFNDNSSFECQTMAHSMTTDALRWHK